MLFGERERGEAKLGVLPPHIAAPAVRFLHVFFARLELVALGGEALHRVLQQPLFVGKFEVHLSPNFAVIPAERSEGRNP